MLIVWSFLSNLGLNTDETNAPALAKAYIVDVEAGAFMSFPLDLHRFLYHMYCLERPVYSSYDICHCYVSNSLG